MPNIIVVFPDQWRGDCLGSQGNEDVETPFLDEMAGEGTLFSRAYSPAPTCIAARACLATGLNPDHTGRLGYRDFVPWNYDKTFMKILRDGGYQTFCSGKTHFYPPRNHLGFEELSLYEIPAFYPDHPSDYHRWLKKESGGLVRDTAEDLNTNSWIVRPWMHNENYHPSSWTMTSAIDQLERRDTTRPFFQQISFHRPHPPFDPPVQYYEQFENKALSPVPIGSWVDSEIPVVTSIAANGGVLPEHLLDRSRKAYYAQLAHIDSQIGRMKQYLKSRKLLDDTWIIFSSDHGEMLGDHHLFRKTVPFEGSARIPLIIKPPEGSGYKSEVNENPVTLCDIMPTILDIARKPIPSILDGRSLLPLIGSTEINGREFIHGEHSPGWQFVTDGKEKYIWNSVSGKEWFFNLVRDPGERENLIGSPDWSASILKWKKRLTGELEQREEDGLVRDGRLVPGISLPSVRAELL